MITFHTRSGSAYEVDEANKCARRSIWSAHNTADTNGKWRAFEYHTPIEVGRSVIFAWSGDTMTTTSYVTEISKTNAAGDEARTVA